jgi:CBS domain containing-hemolysin-like protein
MLPADATVAELLASDDAAAFSRIPLYEGSPDHVVGYVLVREVARSVATGGDRTSTLASHRHDLASLRDDGSVMHGLRHFLQNRGHIAAVVDEFGALRGLVTFEDLIETILGAEIVDESDQVVDMRQLASELRERRTERTRARIRRRQARDASG